jgi:hypothetical protein
MFILLYILGYFCIGIIINYIAFRIADDLLPLSHIFITLFWPFFLLALLIILPEYIICTLVKLITGEK